MLSVGFCFDRPWSAYGWSHIASVVCLFLHRYRWGLQIRGDERGFLEKAVQYRNRGLDLLTLEKSPSLQDSFGGGLYTSLQTGEFRLPVRGPFDLFIVILKTLRTLSRFSSLRPFAVYAYNQDPENVVTGLALKLILGRPLVIVYHHITRLSFAPFGIGIAERRGMGYGLLSSIRLSIVPALTRKSVSYSDLHLALSTSTKRDVEAWAGVENCIVVGNGVDTGKFRPVRAEKEYDAAFLGRIVGQKGIDTLLKAWSLVLQRKPGSKLVLIGGADPDQMRHFGRLAEDIGVANSVVFKGFLSDEEVVKTLNASRMFVFPSLKEGFAQAVSQAMACGLCCVISDIPALRETYGDVAILVPPSDPEALAEKVTTMLEYYSDLSECGARSRQFIMRFDWGDVVEKELRALASLAK